MERRCQTGITREQYRDVVKSRLEVVWWCSVNFTLTPIAESMAIGDKNMDAFGIPASLQIENQEIGMGMFLTSFIRESQ